MSGVKMVEKIQVSKIHEININYDVVAARFRRGRVGRDIWEV